MIKVLKITAQMCVLLSGPGGEGGGAAAGCRGDPEVWSRCYWHPVGREDEPVCWSVGLSGQSFHSHQIPAWQYQPGRLHFKNGLILYFIYYIFTSWTQLYKKFTCTSVFNDYLCPSCIILLGSTDRFNCFCHVDLAGCHTAASWASQSCSGAAGGCPSSFDTCS